MYLQDESNFYIVFCQINPEEKNFGAFIVIITKPNKLAVYSFLTRKITIFVSLFQDD